MNVPNRGYDVSCGQQAGCPSDSYGAAECPKWIGCPWCLGRGAAPIGKGERVGQANCMQARMLPMETATPP